jgi:hypothetical protein
MAWSKQTFFRGSERRLSTTAKVLRSAPRAAMDLPMRGLASPAHPILPNSVDRVAAISYIRQL